MREEFLRKIINKEFDSFTNEELELIITNNNVFQLNKKDLKELEKIVNNVSKSDPSSILQTGLPSCFEILNNLDKQSIAKGTLEINFRDSLIELLNKMSNLQLCVFVDKILKWSKDEKLRFFRNKEYSLHEINSVFSKAFGLSLTFEVFKPGKYKTFCKLDYDRIDKKLFIDTLNNQLVRYLYVLEIIAKVVLDTDEDKLFGTKINKTIRERAVKYIDIIHKERTTIISTGSSPKQTWTYSLCNNISSITIDEDEEFYDEDEDNE